MAEERSAAEHRPDQRALEELVAQVDTGPRSPGGAPGRVLYVLALCWSLFQLWIASPLPFMFNFFIVPATQARSIHLAFAIFLAFTAFPATRGRRPGLTVSGAILGLAAAASFLYALTLFAAGSEQWLIFTATGIALAFAAYAALVPGAPQRIPIADWVLAVVAAFCAIYLFLFYDELARRPGQPTLVDLVVAGCGMVLLLEATRRALGPALTVIGIIFLVYTFAGPYMPDLIAHRGASFARTMSQQWLSAEGVFGIALGVSTSFVFLFVLFSALLDKAGAGAYFTQLAFALLGHMRGGPAKAAVVSSALNGIVSGSSIANVVTGGVFTISLMKRVGYTPIQAGAIETSSSINGQLMPPVMGAAAFLMVEYVGIPYSDVIKHAALPAIISYIALYYIVHLEALKLGLRPIPRSGPARTWLRRLTGVLLGFAVTALVCYGVYYAVLVLKPLFGDFGFWGFTALILVVYVGLVAYASRFPDLPEEDPDKPIEALPPAGPTFKSGLHFLLPVVVLVWCLMVELLSPGLSAFYATALMIVIVVTQRPLFALFRGQGNHGAAWLQGIRELFDGLVAGAHNMIGIGVATAAAGIIVGTVAMTGIGLVLIEVVEAISGGNLVAMLALVALLSLVLGLGLPTTANYIIVASLMAPVVVELGAQAGLIVPLIAVHLFVFYFGLLADVTPPVGLASFAAAAISGADPIRTGITGFFYSLRTVALPFIFVFNTNLLLIGIDTWWHLLLTIFGAVVAMLAFVAATQAYFLVRCRMWEIAALLLIAFTMFRPGFWMNMIEPEFERLPPSTLTEVVEAAPAGGFARLQVEGIDMRGREISKLVMLPLGEPAPALQRLQQAGLMVMNMGDQVQITNVDFSSPAERFGLDFGYNITAILVPADRPAKEWMFVPALLLFGLIAWLQRRREPPESAPARAAVAAGEA